MVAATLLALVAALPPDADLRPEIAWAGTLPDESLRAQAPGSGVLTDPEAFAALWDAWRPGERLPEVDFTKTFVVVGTIDGPNRMFLHLTNDAGNLQTQFGGTRVAGPGFGYLIAVVKRDGIERVKGRPLSKDAAPTANEAPRVEAPSSTDPKTIAPAAKPQRPAARAAESIRVSVRGILETGIVAVGGETTGAVIRAKGVTFEVSLDRPGLRERAEALNGQPAVVAGELLIKPGVETGTRLIIEASRVDLVRSPRR